MDEAAEAWLVDVLNPYATWEEASGGPKGLQGATRERGVTGAWSGERRGRGGNFEL